MSCVTGSPSFADAGTAKHTHRKAAKVLNVAVNIKNELALRILFESHLAHNFVVHWGGKIIVPCWKLRIERFAIVRGIY